MVGVAVGGPASPSGGVHVPAENETELQSDCIVNVSSPSVVSVWSNWALMLARASSTS